MQQDGFNILGGFPEHQRSAIRTIIIELILSTDMAKHFQFVKDFRAVADTLRRGCEKDEDPPKKRDLTYVRLTSSRVCCVCGRVIVPSSLSLLLAHFLCCPFGDSVTHRSAEKITLLSAIVHCSDLGGLTKPWALAEQWSTRVLTEFFNQGDQEQRKHLEVGPLHDRERVNIPKSQVCKPVSPT